MRAAQFLLLSAAGLFMLSGCKTSKPFYPKSEYPPDPWVKGYSDPQDCIGGEKLAAVKLDLPEYPRRAYSKGRQGWVIIRLDVNEAGETENVDIERAVPDRLFSGNAREAVKNWQFEPPNDGLLQNCRVLLRYKLGRVYLGS